jgi:hypothetical protein
MPWMNDEAQFPTPIRATLTLGMIFWHLAWHVLVFCLIKSYASKPNKTSFCSPQPIPPLFIGSMSADKNNAEAGVCWFGAAGFVQLQANLWGYRAPVLLLSSSGLESHDPTYLPQTYTPSPL